MVKFADIQRTLSERGSTSATHFRFFLLAVDAFLFPCLCWEMNTISTKSSVCCVKFIALCSRLDIDNDIQGGEVDGGICSESLIATGLCGLILS
jgi:hypothetical protein